MSGIPPNWVSSIVGGGEASRQAGAARNKETAEQVQGAAPARFADKLQDVISSAERDEQVYSDAEGLGSQGRPFSEQQPEQPPPDPPDEHEPPAGGLDVQA